MSGPRGVRRRDKGEREAVFLGGGGGGGICPERRCGSAASRGEETPRWVWREKRGGLTAEATGSPGEWNGGREARAWGRCGWGARGRGSGGEGGSSVPLPQPGPGPPADSAPRRRSPRPGLTVREVAPAEAAGEGGRRWEGGTLRLRLRLRPAAPGRRVLVEAAAVSGFNAQTAGEESTAQARCGHRCQSERGGARAPAVSKATGWRRKESPYLHLVLATATGGGVGGWGATRTALLSCHSNKERPLSHKFTAVSRERAHLVTMATGNSPFLFP
ncbi:unnamed protein product [Rangifer tarandus platyrhynchus]|uniref:Uncharacterized protein n=1 Tax=Rangifer tarandus platyrhynchus TaxID=3082113 RepID=A0ABN8ZNN2_RANTA|nr:unnamed protein product [Rangifer tarandus platyrhynchus]